MSIGDRVRNPVTNTLWYLLRLLWIPLLCGVGYLLANQRAGAVDEPIAERARVETPAAATPVLSARRIPGVVGLPQRLGALTASIEPVLAEVRGVDSCIVVTTATAAPLYQYNETLPLVPASGQKLVTAFAALNLLGPEHTFRTVLATDARVNGGAIEGDLYLIGSGDPVLATADYTASFKNQPQIRTEFEALVRGLQEQGINRIRGSLIADPTRYDDQRYVESWPFAFRTGQGEQPSGPLSALNLNDGFTSFPESDQEFGGSGRRVSSQNPPLDTVGALQRLLANAGIVVDDGVKVAKAPPVPNELASVSSPPLSVIVGEMLRESDNTTAELLIKEIGAVKAQQGTHDAGISIVRQFLVDVGLALPNTFVDDGSGLSSNNRVTCLELARIIAVSGPDSPLQAGLAVGAESGTLVDRFAASRAAGKVAAKTGTLGGVSSLSGVVDTDPGDRVVFSIIANGADEEALKGTEERLAEKLLDWPAGPSTEAIGPRPVAG